MLSADTQIYLQSFSILKGFWKAPEQKLTWKTDKQASEANLGFSPKWVLISSGAGDPYIHSAR